MRVVVTVDDRRLTELLASLRARALNPKPVLNHIADDFLDIEQRRFSTSPWQPDVPEWTTQKQAHGGSTRTLVFHGALEKSLTRRGAKYSRRRFPDPHTIIFGTSDPVAHLHQSGTADRWVQTWRGQPLAKPRFAGRVPARSLVRLDRPEKERWSRMVLDWLMVARDAPRAVAGWTGRGL